MSTAVEKLVSRLHPMDEYGEWVRLNIDATVSSFREGKWVRAAMQDLDLGNLDMDD